MRTTWLLVAGIAEGMLIISLGGDSDATSFFADVNSFVVGCRRKLAAEADCATRGPSRSLSTLHVAGAVPTSTRWRQGCNTHVQELLETLSIAAP